METRHRAYQEREQEMLNMDDIGEVYRLKVIRGRVEIDRILN